jgi:hypothetical protein
MVSRNGGNNRAIGTVLGRFRNRPGELSCGRRLWGLWISERRTVAGGAGVVYGLAASA